MHLNLNSFQAGKSLSDVSIRLFGSKGVAELHYEGVVGIYGDEPWEWEGSVGPASPQPGHANIYAVGNEAPAQRAAGIFHDALEEADPEKEKAFIESITSGKFTIKRPWEPNRRSARSWDARPAYTGGGNHLG